MARNQKPTSPQSLYSYFMRNLTLVSKGFASVSKDPSRKKIYKLRVSLRRIRSMLEVIKASGTIELKDTVSKELSFLFKALGKQRDIEVAIKLAKELGVEAKKLKVKRKKHQAKNKALFSSVKPLEIVGPLKKIGKTIRKKTLSLDPFLDQVQTSLPKSLRTPRDIHGLRIAMKKLRYLLESQNVPVSQFKVVQDILGRYNDLENLSQLLGPHKEIKRALGLQLKEAKRASVKGKGLLLREIKKLRTK